MDKIDAYIAANTWGSYYDIVEKTMKANSPETFTILTEESTTEKTITKKTVQKIENNGTLDPREINPFKADSLQRLVFKN